MTETNRAGPTDTVPMARGRTRARARARPIASPVRAPEQEGATPEPGGPAPRPGHPRRSGQVRLGARVVDEASDLRRRHQRETIDRLMDRAAHLPAPDRLLLEAVYRDGRSARELASLSGQSPRRVRARIKRLTRRAMSPEFRFVARELELSAAGAGAEGGRGGPAWTRTRRTIARAIYLEGRSMREIVRTTGLSLHTVRAHRGAIEAQIESARGRDPSDHVGTRP